MKARSRKSLIFIDRKSLKKVQFCAGGLSVHFLLAPRLFLIRTPHQLKSVLIISLNDSGLTKDSGKCIHSAEINCRICRELKAWKVLLALPLILSYEQQLADFDKMHRIYSVCAEYAMRYLILHDFWITPLKNLIPITLYLVLIKKSNFYR